MQPGDVLAGRYEVERLLGRGGMGQVFRARDRVLNRHVALKVLAGDLVDDDHSVERILTEARLAAKVRHPNVVQVLDAIVGTDHAPVIVLELVEGPSLAQVVAERGPLPVEEALDVLGEVAAGLAAAHAADLVHRDVSPSNVLLDGGTARLTDFGIARSTAAERTLTGTIRGSVAYVAPEQATGTAVGPATDVYALACVGVTLLTGRPPFEAEEPLGVVHQHVAAPPPDVRAVRGDVPMPVAVALQASMAKDPAKRIGTAAAFAAAIGRPLRNDDTDVVVLPSVDGGVEHTSLQTVALDGGTGPTGGVGHGSGPVVVIGTVTDPGSGPSGQPEDRGRRRPSLPWIAGAIVAAIVGGILVGQLLPTPATVAATAGGGAGADEDALAPEDPMVDLIEDRLLALRGALVELQTADDVALDRGAVIDEGIDRALTALMVGDQAALPTELETLRDVIREGVAADDVTPAAELTLLEAILAVEQTLDRT